MVSPTVPHVRAEENARAASAKGWAVIPIKVIVFLPSGHVRGTCARFAVAMAKTFARAVDVQEKHFCILVRAVAVVGSCGVVSDGGGLRNRSILGIAFGPPSECGSLFFEAHGKSCTNTD